MKPARRLDQFAQDARFAVRTLRRQPGFTLAAILTLAFGIGATAAILSVVNGVIVRPLPYPNASRVVLISVTGLPESPLAGQTMPFSAANFTDLRAGVQTLEHTAAFRAWTYTLAEGGEAELVTGARASAGWFEALGVKPAMGRLFEAQDEQIGSEPVAILGDGLWRRRLGGDRTVLGRPITLNGERFTVVGVMPRGFQFPRGTELPAGFQFGDRSEIWTPLVFSANELEFRGLQNLVVLGLPRPGRPASAVQSDVALVMSRLAEQYPGYNKGMTARTQPLQEPAVAAVRPALLVLLGAVGLLLLIACVNVSNLLLTRTAARAREVAVRAALGAGRRRLLRQFVTENLILVLIGGVIGVAAAILGRSALLALAPASLPRREDISLDWRVLSGVIGLMLTIGAAFGALVALETGGGDRSERLREGARGGEGRSSRRLRHGLVILEVAISVMLLSGAGVLGRTFLNLRRVEPGFEANGLLTAQASLPRVTSDFSQFVKLAPQWARFYRELTDRLARQPGIREVGVASMLPLTGGFESAGFRIEGRPPLQPGQDQSALYTGVSDGYFRAMGIPLVRGRFFDATDRDSASATMIVSQAMARTYWPNQDPIGARLQTMFGRPLEIVGVVGDIHHRDIRSSPTPAMYFPLSLYPTPNMYLVVRTGGDPLGALPAVRQALRAIDPAVPLTQVLTMEQLLAGSLAEQRMSAMLVGIFALAALGLAVIGLYGVVSFGVARRVREIGIRLALGASPRSLVGKVLGEGAALSLIGVGLGVAGAAALGRVLSRMMFEVSPSDPPTLAVVSVLLVIVALAASLVPARRAMRVDPATALREE